MLEDIPDVAYIIFSFPVKMLPLFDEAVLAYQDELIDTHKDKHMSVKRDVHVRIFGFNFQNSDGITRYLIFLKKDLIRALMNKYKD